MKTYEIYPLINQILDDNEMSCQTYLQNYGIRNPAPIVMWLVRGNGRNILVDSGASIGELSTKNHHPALQTEDQLPDNLLRKAGVDPKDIDTVIITHMHFDHCYNLEYFPNAKIYVQKKELEYAINPYPPHALYYESAKVGMQPPWLTHIDRFTIMDGDWTLCEGIEVYFMPGHSPGMQNVAVNTTGGIYLIASDNLPLFLNWQGTGIHKHIPSAIHCSLDDYYKSLERMERVCDYPLPSHDMKLLQYDIFPPKDDQEFPPK